MLELKTSTVSLKTIEWILAEMEDYLDTCTVWINLMDVT